MPRRPPPRPSRRAPADRRRRGRGGALRSSARRRAPPGAPRGRTARGRRKRRTRSRSGAGGPAAGSSTGARGGRARGGGQRSGASRGRRLLLLPLRSADPRRRTRRRAELLPHQRGAVRRDISPSATRPTRVLERVAIRRATPQASGSENLTSPRTSRLRLPLLAVHVGATARTVVR